MLSMERSVSTKSFKELLSNYQNVKDYVEQKKGSIAISKVLIANNGMAAVKAMRSIRKWSYEVFGNERTIEFTVMCTPEDLSVNAEYIRMADNHVQVPGGSSNHNYANVDLIVQLALRTNVHAVWVGWGFASENPILSDKLKELNIVFIGPPASAMRALGDKIASTIVAQSANVPCVDWSGQGLLLQNLNSDTFISSVPSHLYKQATVDSVEHGLKHAKRIGFPIMVFCTNLD
jgi:acetyl-CoA carboxylase/biotin carboxylase 1